MSAAVGAALKKVALLLLGDPKARKKILTVVLVVLLAILLPVKSTRRPSRSGW